MRLIRRAKVQYFRSVYTATLADCRSLNVISGRNDAGKSNILKALHLFFNGLAEWQEPLDFYRDISIQRLDEVRRVTIKGKQFISVEIEFFRPRNYAGSLPETFKVKRTWLRPPTEDYIQTDNLESLANQEKLPASLNTAKRFLPIFLNRAHFEYVPAVKDRAYFTHLLSRLQATLLGIRISGTSEIGELAGRLAGHIQGQVEQLVSDFERATRLETSIEPPSELSALFQAFLVSTRSEMGPIPLIRRGDGIQARFLPSVLHYIASNSGDFFVWGFEEPENSLEYAHADTLAEDFESIYTADAQIFLTTHSPAFVALKGDETACFRAFQQAGMTEVAQIRPAAGGRRHEEALRAEIGIVRIQEEVHQEYSSKLEELARLEETVGRLKIEIREARKPLVLLEGPNDMSTLELAWGALYPDTEMPFIARAADAAAGAGQQEGGGAPSLRRMIESIHPEEERKAVAVFDRDREGVHQFGRLSNRFRTWRGEDSVKRHVNGLAFALLLPSPAFRSSYAAASNLPMEYLFTDEALTLRTGSGRGLSIREAEPASISMAPAQQLPLTPGQAETIRGIVDLTAYRKIAAGKTVFAQQIVPHLEPQEFEGFRPLLELIQQVLTA